MFKSFQDAAVSYSFSKEQSNIQENKTIFS